MSDTPRTDALMVALGPNFSSDGKLPALAELSRQLERELIESEKERVRLEDELAEAGWHEE